MRCCPRKPQFFVWICMAVGWLWAGPASAGVHPDLQDLDFTWFEPATVGSGPTFIQYQLAIQAGRPPTGEYSPAFVQTVLERATESVSAFMSARGLAQTQCRTNKVTLYIVSHRAGCRYPQHATPRAKHASQLAYPELMTCIGPAWMEARAGRPPKPTRHGVTWARRQATHTS